MLSLLGQLLLGLVFSVIIIILYWRFRSPWKLEIPVALNQERWTIVPPDTHHSNTDLIKFGEQFLLVHATSPWHFASKKCRLVIRSSPDARTWRIVHEITLPGEDVRDPKFAVINNKLFLYFLPNVILEPKPYDTLYCTSEDGMHWSRPEKLSIHGWLLWRPRTPDGITYYVPAYWRGFGNVTLFKSGDGITWSRVGPIYEGESVTETDIIFRDDGTMLTTARVERYASLWGHTPEGYTLIGTANPPYTDWEYSRSQETRLDGPCLFQLGERTYACGRRHLGGSAYRGSCWGRKRTSLYVVTPERLVFLCDLPSCGDTSYAGAVADGDNVFICYYTSPPDRDYPWLFGMLSGTSIEMVRFNGADLEKLAAGKLGA
jgi:hypothetical protein